MSYNPSRKRFLAKLAGLMAAIGFAPKVLTGSVSRAVASASPSATIQLRPEPRAVARGADSV